MRSTTCMWRSCSATLYDIGGEQTLKGLALFDRERVHIDAGWSWAHSEANHALIVDYSAALEAIDDLRYHNSRDQLLHAPKWHCTQRDSSAATVKR